MSDEPATEEETDEQRERRIRAAEASRHQYRLVTGVDGTGAASYGYACGCGQAEEGVDGFPTEAERDAATARHVESACKRAVRRGDG